MEPILGPFLCCLLPHSQPCLAVSWLATGGHDHTSFARTTSCSEWLSPTRLSTLREQLLRGDKNWQGEAEWQGPGRCALWAGPGRCAWWAGPGQVRLVGGAAELKPCPGAGLVPHPWKPSRPAGHKEGKEGGMKEEEGDREGDSAWLL